MDPMRRRTRSIVAVAASLGLLVLDAQATSADPGHLDSTFSGDGQQTIDFGGDIEGADAVAVRQDGRVVVAGLTDVGTTWDFAVARLLPNGLPDPTFSGDGRVRTDFSTASTKRWDSAHDVAIDDQGRTVVVGSSMVGTNASWAIARYTLLGTLDPAFSGDGKVIVDHGDSKQDIAFAVGVRPNGKVYVAGTIPDGPSADRMAVMRFKADGTPDTTFSGDGLAIIDFPSGSELASDMAVDDDGGVVVVGRYAAAGSDSKMVIARLTPSGAFDASFKGGGKTRVGYPGLAATATAVALAPDGRIVVGGRRQVGHGQGFPIVVRLTTNGDLDPTWSGDGTSIPFVNGEITAVVVQANGRVVSLGMTTIDGIPAIVCRQKVNGKPDLLFGQSGCAIGPLISANSFLQDVAIGPGGTVVVAGTSAQSDLLAARYLGS